MTDLARRLLGAYIKRAHIPPNARFDDSIPDGEDECRVLATDFSDFRVVILDYVAWEGKNTIRRVHIKSVDDQYIHAHCIERDAHRTFRLDRVRAVFDIDGELVLDTSELLASADFVENDLAELKSWRPENQYQWLKKQLIGEACLIQAIILADGHDHPAEKRLFREYMCMRAEEVAPFTLPSKQRKYIRRWITCVGPHDQGVELSIAAIKRMRSNQIKRLLVTMKDIILADGLVHPQETARFKELGYALQEIAKSVD